MNRPAEPYPSILDAAAALRADEITATGLLELSLERIERLEPELHAFATRTTTAARRQAERADDDLRRGRDRGPLHGIPIGVKDLVSVRDVPLAAGMPLRGTARSTHDAPVIDRLRDAGAVIVGTLQMTEGAYFEHHPDVVAPANPWGPATLWPGASSSGPAVAVAAGLVYAALGSDTGGSIRFPAAANRILGLKPTHGLITTRGTFPAADTLDHLGVFTRNADDSAAVLHAVADPDDHDLRFRPLRDRPADPGPVSELRIGIDRRDDDAVDPTTRAAIDRVASILSSAGARVVATELPDTSAAREAWTVICSVEAAHHHRDTYPARAGSYGPLADFLDLGRGTSAMALVDAYRAKAAVTDEYARTFDGIDVLLTPTQPTSEVTLGEKDELIADPAALAEFTRFATPHNMTGQPTLTVPVAVGERWSSVQLVGRHLDEATLFSVGRLLPRAPHLP